MYKENNMCECIQVNGVVRPSKGCKTCFPNEPHKHAELIKAWADGAEIEYYSPSQDKWIICVNNRPQWHEDMAYRVKPTPKPDVVKWGNINVRKDIYNSLNLRVNEVDQTDANVKLVFDGETEKLKEVIVL
jgi:hypothetical protein